jgi:enamine deaminase RidA (YjgF/YER057c/UK114 family)
MEHPVRFVNPEPLSVPSGFAHAAVDVSNNIVYVSGQVAYDCRKEIVGQGCLATQTIQVLTNISLALEAAGSDLKHLTKLTYFVVGLDEEKVATIRNAREPFFSADRLPASTMVGVASLARPELLLEVEAYAVGRTAR